MESLNVRVEKNALAAAVNSAVLVSQENTLEVLKSVLLSFSESELKLIAGDGKGFTVTPVSLVENQGVTGLVLVNASYLKSAVAALTGDCLIRVGENEVVIESEQELITLPRLNEAEFPAYEAKDEQGVTLSFTKQTFVSLVKKVFYSAAKKDVRYYLNGLCVSVGSLGQHVDFVATDGHRLGFARYLLQSPVATDLCGLKAIVDNKTVSNVLKILGKKPEGTIKVFLSETLVKFEFDGQVITGCPIDGRYPDYETVIPDTRTQNLTRVFTNKAQLIKAFTKVLPLSNEHKGVRLSLEDNTLNIIVHNTDDVVAKTWVNVNYTGEPLEIGFNGKYLVDSLKNINGDVVDVFFSDENSPVLIRPYGDDLNKAVVMPMRLAN